MAWNTSPFAQPPLRRRPPPAPPPRPTPVLTEQEAEFHAREFGSHGALLPAPAPASPQPPPPAPFVIEPWPEDERRRACAAVEPEPPKPPPTIWEIAARNGDLGEPPPPPGPPTRLAPLERFVPPPVDWRAEELEAARRNEQALAEEEPRRPSHPPRRLTP